jgi:pimeloyl-ACP methyl ester carboxylesterase
MKKRGIALACRHVTETQRVVTEDGVRLAVTSHGNAAHQAILLIPGLGAAASVFEPLVPSLQRRYRVITYDPRGIGASDRGDSELSLPLMAGDGIAVLNGFALTRPHVLGASMGGAIAQQLAVDHPDRVDHLLLAATAPAGRKAIPPDPRAMDALLGKGARTPGDAYRLACTVLYSPHFQRTHPDFIAAQIAQRALHPVKPRVFSAQQAALARAGDLGDRLADIVAPTLVMHGTADVVSPIENAQMLATRIPHARTRWFEGCGHLFFHERPEETGRVVHEFVRG